MKNTPYKLRSLDKTAIKSAARKALMMANSGYYSWSLEQQERFRVTMDKQSRQKVEQVLLANLLNIKCSLEEVDEIWRDQPLEKLNILNWGSLLTSSSRYTI